MDKRDHAVALASKGFKVFPCEPNGKKPVWPQRLGKETSDPAKAREIWTEAVTGEALDYNIGISTDELFVFDFDTKGDENVQSIFRKITEQYFVEGQPASVCTLTPSGGIHLYTRLAPGQKAANSVKSTFGAQIDTRSWHGYVLGPGSSIDGHSYSWLTSGPDGLHEPATIGDIPFCPDAVLAIAGAPTERPELDPTIKWDEPAAISAASAFLTHAAPAIQGAGGNDHTYRVAARLRQFGVSADTAINLMLTWNVNCEPPWQIEELTKLIDNAYAYATATPHTPGAEFENYPMDTQAYTDQLAPDTYKSPDWPSPTRNIDFDIHGLPKRQWIIPGLLARTFVTGLIAPSGAGKTQFAVQMLLALTTGKPGLISTNPIQPHSVWMWNQEDDLTELRRRMAAAMAHFKIDWNDFSKELYLDSGVEKSLMLVARDSHGHLRETKRVATIIRHMIANNISALIIDPLIEFHEADENNNVEMKTVAATLRKIAVQANAAVLVGHHTKKPDGARSDGFAGNADSGRGASSLQGVTRVMATLYAMTENDAKKLKIKPEDRWQYIRLDGAKSNISASGSGSKPEWLQRVGQAIGHEETEEVGVLVPIDLAVSRVMREAEQDHEVVAAKVEAKGKEMPEFDEAHPYAVALADALEQEEAVAGKYVSLSAYRLIACEALGVSALRDRAFGKWCKAQERKTLSAGKGRSIKFLPPVAKGASSRIAWHAPDSLPEIDPSEYQEYLD